MKGGLNGMATLLESVTTLLDGDGGYEKLGGAVGEDGAAITSVAEQAVPAILVGMADRAARRGGSDVVQRLLSDDRAPDLSTGSGADPLDALLSGATSASSKGAGTRYGDVVLDEIFGIERDGLVTDLAAKANVGRSAVSRSLPLLAPLVMGALRDRQQAQELDGLGMADLLLAEKQHLDDRGLLLDDASAGPAGSRAILSTEAAAKTSVGSIDGTFDGKGSNVSWLWWAIGSTVLVLLMAWLLSMCSGSGDENGLAESTDPDGPTVDENPDGNDADGTDPESTDADSTESSSGGRARGVAAGSATGSLELDPELDDRIDEALATDPGNGGIAEADQDEVQIAEDPVPDPDPGPEVDPSLPSPGTMLNAELSLGAVTFETTSDEVTAEGVEALAVVAAYLLANPAVRVEIGGHTDSDGAEDANQDLSRRRAEAVAVYLQEAGVSADRMEAVGYGEAVPLTDNDSSASKARNRRIDFKVL